MMLRFVKWTTVVLLLLGLAVAPAAAQGSGAVSGAVRNANTGAGIVGVTVYVLDSAGGVVASETTGTGGAYLATGLPAGTYYVKTYNTLGYIDEVYDNLPCDGGVCPDVTGGTGVAIAGTGTTPGVDFALELAGSISGSVWDDETSAPLAGVSVFVYNAAGIQVGVGYTNASGAYAVGGLAGGTYYARTGNSYGFVDELFGFQPCPMGVCPPVTSGDAIEVTAGATTRGISFWLSVGGAVTGTVAHAVSGDYLDGVIIFIYDSAGIQVGFGDAAGGVFMLDQLPAGSYYLRTVNAAGFVDELYDNLPCPGGVCPPVTSGTAVSVASGVMTGDIDFRLMPLLPGGSVRSDFTGDLTSDLLWRGTGGDLWLWGIKNAAHATDAYVGAVADPNWEIKGQADLNGDGMTDLVWRHKLDGTVYYWQLDGAHWAMPATELFVATVDISYDIVGTGDFDGDGKADLLWRNPAIGDLWLWRMNGAEVLGQSYVDTVDLSYAIRGLGDVNGDLKADVIWQGVAGDLWVWLMNGAVKDVQAYVGTVADQNYQVQQIADFDADMKADLLWWNSVAGDVWIWRLDGADVLSEHCVGVVANTDYRIQAAGDYNGDQKADILWRNVVAGDMWIWLMDGPAKASEAYLGTVGDPGYQIVK
ncbi:MAG TPA: carboxypeptidase regulatory-like domain-containing protein [Vicinamibacterales bacterium]|nr:carboxypeptidase regulatory-like domain-containing protein [Vicinamibacterales bacterium]